MGPDGGGCGDVALELGIRGVVDLVVTRKLLVEVGDEREEVVERGVRGRYGTGGRLVCSHSECDCSGAEVGMREEDVA